MYLTFVLFLMGASSPSGYEIARVQHGLATVYWPGDGHSGKICADGKPFTKTRCHIAHRFWPLGSKVRVCAKRTQRCAISYIGDRGPFGACDAKGMNRHYACKGRWSLKIRRKDPGTWRGIADLSRCVWKKIGGSGFQPIRLELLRKTKKRRPSHKLQTTRRLPPQLVAILREPYPYPL